MTRLIGAAHLSALALEPDEFIRASADAGFDFVGLRVLPATPTEALSPVVPGTPAFEAARRALTETGITVCDIEFLPLGPQTSRENWLPALEAGAALGAVAFTVAGADDDVSRLTDTLAALVADAREHGILPALEPISYNVVATVAQAADIARAAGAGVLVDALHFHRAGGTLEDLARLDDAMLPLAQLCDGPRQVDFDLRVDAPLPRGMSAEGSPRILESRAMRFAPGSGAFALADLVRALPAGLPLSLEVPNAQEIDRLGPLGWLRKLRASTDALLPSIEGTA